MLNRYLFIIIVCLLICLWKPTANNTTNRSQSKAISNYIGKIDELKSIRPNTQHSAEQEIYFYRLHMLYYNGVPDKYDNAGNKVKGIEPDSNKCLSYLRKSISCRDNPKLWLLLASIYQNGMYNMDPDLNIAAQIYYYIYTKYSGTEASAMAWDEYNNATSEIDTINTYKWLNRKYEPKKNQHHEKICKLFKKTQQTPYTPNTFKAQETRVNNNNFFRANADNNEPILDTDDHRRNDMHNTHNSQVVATVAKSVKTLQESTPINIPLHQTVKDIRQLILSKPACDRRDDALKSLECIERNILPITSVNMKETDVLNIIWNRINMNHLDNDRDNIKDILYSQLADMQEHSKSVCPTGRLERLVDCLNTFDRDVSIKPTYIVNQEMLNKAEQIRNQHYDKVRRDRGDAMVEQYQSGTAADQDLFDERLKTDILDQLKTDYVTTGIVTENKFKVLTDKWINDI